MYQVIYLLKTPFNYLISCAVSNTFDNTEESPELSNPNIYLNLLSNEYENAQCASKLEDYVTSIGFVIYYKNNNISSKYKIPTDVFINPKQLKIQFRENVKEHNFSKNNIEFKDIETLENNSFNIYLLLSKESNNFLISISPNKSSGFHTLVKHLFYKANTEIRLKFTLDFNSILNDTEFFECTTKPINLSKSTYIYYFQDKVEASKARYENLKKVTKQSEQKEPKNTNTIKKEKTANHRQSAVYADNRVSSQINNSSNKKSVKAARNRDRKPPSSEESRGYTSASDASIVEHSSIKSSSDKTQPNILDPVDSTKTKEQSNESNLNSETSSSEQPEKLQEKLLFWSIIILSFVLLVLILVVVTFVFGK
ncbi:hypothetical protein CDIK_0331 [Cucumispora dikerogammari]|nr:hypothetical protein CDIK_0331 [Cucumispora dikerogammari]